MWRRGVKRICIKYGRQIYRGKLVRFFATGSWQTIYRYYYVCSSLIWSSGCHVLPNIIRDSRFNLVYTLSIGDEWRGVNLTFLKQVGNYLMSWNIYIFLLSQINYFRSDLKSYLVFDIFLYTYELPLCNWAIHSDN